MENKEKLECLEDVYINSLEGERNTEKVKNILDVIIKIKTIQSFNR